MAGSSAGAVRMTQDVSTGHGCFASTPTATGSVTVFTDQLPQVRMTDMYQMHCCPLMGCHAPMASQGSVTVFSDQLAKHLMGHACDCGDFAATGSLTTFAGM